MSRLRKKRFKGMNHPEFLNLSNSKANHSTDWTESMCHLDDFRMYVFKIKKCPRNRSHDWTCCPFAHRGEKARRRDPCRFNYAAIACPEFRNGKCPKGDSCEFAHGIFEFWLHPAKYRTRSCNAGQYCQRKVCFFAHAPEQLRSAWKQKRRYRVRLGGGTENMSCGFVGEGSSTGSSSPPATMGVRDGILKEGWDVSEKLGMFKIKDKVKKEDDTGEGSFGYGDVSGFPNIAWITELVN
ncbi:zinc finger CCCH domain-containing protein 54-like isoform X2 [Macadamia integrifolia]|nr:zinc finger CCCH domain-containing protein 54-like isoform X2 [Macadamia integrifolia]